MSFNQLHPHISLEASTIDLCMPVSTTGLEAHSHCDRIVKEAGVSIFTLSVGLGRVNGCVLVHVRVYVIINVRTNSRVWYTSPHSKHQTYTGVFIHYASVSHHIGLGT